MTQTQCMAAAKEMKECFSDHGVRCSIELRSGRGVDPWALIKKYLRMHHHVASWYRSGGPLTPFYDTVRNGRSDLVGPLANGYGGFDLVYRIITMGEANHAGSGGPITIDGVYIAANSARKPTWGTEWEGGYQDWEIIPGMLEFMGRSDAALADYGVLGTARPITSQMEHSTWTPRKIDRRNFTRTRGIALTTKYNQPKPQGDWFDMADRQDLLEAVAEATYPKRIIRTDFSEAEGHPVWISDGMTYKIRTDFRGLLDQHVKTRRQEMNIPGADGAERLPQSLIDQIPEVPHVPMTVLFDLWAATFDPAKPSALHQIVSQGVDLAAS